MQGQLEGEQIGRYLVRQWLGGGGVATVYRADDQVSGQPVALKILPPNPDPATLDRFRREALKAGSLRHPHIVRILQVGTAGSSPANIAAYIAMDLVEGESLATFLARHGQLRPEESCLLLEPIARALAFAHSHGVVHRDVKPSNILLRPANPRSDSHTDAQRVRLEGIPYAVVPMLSDFGIARFLDMPELTNEGRTVGTPAFMAPEQCMGSREVDGRADIYSLGTVLYRCVTGRLPFNGSTTQILHAHVFEAVVIDEHMARTLPPAVVQILQRTLAKAPEDRYQHAEELADVLASVGRAASDRQYAHTAADATQANTTGTMTLEGLPALPTAPTSHSAPSNHGTGSAVQVLVPAVRTVEKPVVAARSAKAVRKRGPNWERVLWAAFFVLLIGGGGLWRANAWLRERARDEGEQFTLPPLVMVTFTPAPGGEPIVAAVVPEVVTPTVPPVAATSAPTDTPLSAPTVTPFPAVATEAPTIPPTAIPPSLPVVAEPTTPTPAENLPTPTAIPTVMRAEEIAGTCAMVIDEFFLPSVNQLTGSLQSDFWCPTDPARVASGQWLPFERGTMVAVDGDPLVYVYYESGSWEQVPRAEGDAPEGIPQVPAPFAGVLAAEGRYMLLGEPLQEEPLQSETLIQPFGGGIALGNRSSAQILFMARSDLRF